MQKRDFIQQATIEFMPQLDWNADQSVRYAERLWAVLSERGYGDSKPTGPRDIPRAYDQLSRQPLMKAAFDLFWTAFDYKQGRDRAAARWLQMGQMEKSEYDRIIAAAKKEADNRKNLPDGRVPKMAEGWLAERRWTDTEETSTETAQKQKTQRQRDIQRAHQDLAHAKKMAEQSRDPYWHDEAIRLTERLKQLRDNHD